MSSLSSSVGAVTGTGMAAASISSAGIGAGVQTTGGEAAAGNSAAAGASSNLTQGGAAGGAGQGGAAAASTTISQSFESLSASLTESSFSGSLRIGGESLQQDPLKLILALLLLALGAKQSEKRGKNSALDLLASMAGLSAQQQTVQLDIYQSSQSQVASVSSSMTSTAVTAAAYSSGSGAASAAGGQVNLTA